jgi:HK97 gp10 family phage protein
MPMRGSREHIRRLKRLQGPEMVRFVGAALFEGGEAIQTEAQRLITTGSVSGKGHVPSLPGEPPNQDSGVLANNIETTQPEPLKVVVGSYAPYASPLEFGTSQMAARPYMVPARNNKRREVVDKVERAVAHAVRRSGK